MVLVLGADNNSENKLGYFTKYGDEAVDVAPFGDLYKTELRKVAKHIGVNQKFLEKSHLLGSGKAKQMKEELGEP